MLTCACSGERCDWLTHAAGGTPCATTCAQELAPVGWERSTDGDGYICTSCAFIRSQRANGPLVPAPFPHNGSVGL